MIFLVIPRKEGEQDDQLDLCRSCDISFEEEGAVNKDGNEKLCFEGKEG
jgi:hypothetical protein